MWKFSVPDIPAGLSCQTSSEPQRPIYARRSFLPLAFVPRPVPVSCRTLVLCPISYPLSSETLPFECSWALKTPWCRFEVIFPWFALAAPVRRCCLSIGAIWVWRLGNLDPNGESIQGRAKGIAVPCQTLHVPAGTVCQRLVECFQAY